MPSYTLYYFNGRGRAEILRMMFAAAGVQYTDKRFEFSEWDKYRNDMPCMVVPVLEFDGSKMPETMSIARYLAREFGFYSNNNMDMMRMDYICDCFYEILDDYMRYYHWKNGRFRFGNNGDMAPEMGGNGDTMSDNYDNYLYWRYMNTFNRIMPFMERSLGMRNDGSKFFMGEQMMCCDMMFYSCMESMYVENQSMFSNYPKLMGLFNRVAGHPKISAYLKSRSNTNW